MSSQAARATSKRVSEREFEDYIRTELRMRSGLGYRVRPHHGGFLLYIGSLPPKSKLSVPMDTAQSSEVRVVTRKTAQRFDMTVSQQADIGNTQVYEFSPS